MRQFILAAVAAASLLPGVCAADDVARYQAEAMPYVQAALTMPMRELGHQAKMNTAWNALRLGLAMLAGRSGAFTTDDADDAAKLQSLEADITPQIDSYLQAHPGVDANHVKWFAVAHESREETSFVEHYLRVYSADYWLERAAYAQIRVTGFVPAHTTDGDVIDTNIVMTAAQCVVAVRRAAGLDYKLWSTLPLPVRLMQRTPHEDMQLNVDRDLNAKDAHLKYPTGAAACGSDDQFKADVAALKAAS